jgi:hypothetical protein
MFMLLFGFSHNGEGDSKRLLDVRLNCLMGMIALIYDRFSYLEKYFCEEKR